MAQPIIQQCKNCNSLIELQKKLKCTILFLVNRKLNGRRFNINAPIDQKQFRDLQVYDRIIKKKLINHTYPCAGIDNQDIVTKLSAIVQEDECSQCEDCFPEQSTTTTTILP